MEVSIPSQKIAVPREAQLIMAMKKIPRKKIPSLKLKNINVVLSSKTEKQPDTFITDEKIDEDAF